MITEVNVGGMAVEAELSHQYSIKFCCHATDCLLNICGDQIVDLSTVRLWVVHFSSGEWHERTSHVLDNHADFFYKRGIQALAEL